MSAGFESLNRNNSVSFVPSTNLDSTVEANSAQAIPQQLRLEQLSPTKRSTRASREALPDEPCGGDNTTDISGSSANAPLNEAEQRIDTAPESVCNIDLRPHDVDENSEAEPEAQGGKHDAILNRVAEVREQQGVSMRTMARRMGIDIRSYRQYEDPCRDLTASELYRLQAAFQVPISDLLIDRDTLDRPTAERAKLIKIMKTAVAMKESQLGQRTDRWAQMLQEQLIELMPELKDVGGWPQFGARRGTSAVGRALQTPIDVSNLGSLD